MLGVSFATTADYSDATTLNPDREVDLIVSTDHPTFIQTLRINQKDGSRNWDGGDVPLPACDVRLCKVAGIRFKTNGATPAIVYVLWTYDKDDVEVRSFSTN